MPDQSAAADRVVETDLPNRLDRLPWSGWHTLIIAALCTSWLLDGLEVTFVGTLSGVLQSGAGLSLSDRQVTGAATIYLAGAVTGALAFGYLTDRFGRRRLFFVTLATYSVATVASAFSWGFASFAAFRFFTGIGIGGEYAAINSAVDELIPGRLRGTVDLIVNGTFWLGATLGSLVAMVLLSGHVPQAIGWRLAFGVGGALAIGVILLRLFVPESPRWLMLRGREEDAERIIGDIEAKVGKGGARALPPVTGDRIRIRVRDHTPLAEVFRNMAGANLKRSVLGLALMIAQAFFFNAVFFSYGLVVKVFFHVPDGALPLHLLPFTVASFLGPLTLGRLFDTVGRKPMITACYGLAGVLLMGAATAFGLGVIGVWGLGAVFAVIFFVASSAASAAYLTVSEIFPLEIRAFAIALFYAAGTAAGGVAAPLLFGELLSTGSKPALALGYALGAALMIAGAVFEQLFGVEAAGKSLEAVSKPLQSA